MAFRFIKSRITFKVIALVFKWIAILIEIKIPFYSFIQKMGCLLLLLSFVGNSVQEWKDCLDLTASSFFIQKMLLSGRDQLESGDTYFDISVIFFQYVL